MATKKISELVSASTPLDGTGLVEIVQGGFNRKTTVSEIGTTRETERAWDDELLFDKNEIFYTIHELTTDVNYTVASSGNLDGKTSAIRQRIITDGSYTINFTGFDYIYGITSGAILEAGNYEIYFLRDPEGSVVVNVPGVTQQTSGLSQLLTPSDFAVVADGENALDMSWTDVANETQYQIERSLTGTGGWTLYSNPAQNATADTETGLNPGDVVYYRIKAVGDGVTILIHPIQQHRDQQKITAMLLRQRLHLIPLMAQVHGQ